MSNPYLTMPLSRVIADAQYGVSLAREALRLRDPAMAKMLGIGIGPEEANRKNCIIQATGDFLSSQKSKRT